MTDTIRLQEYDSYFLHRMVKYLEEVSKNTDSPGCANLLLAKNKIVAAIIEIENS